MLTTLRWAPGSHQMADVLTKGNASAADTWRGFRDQKRYALYDETHALQIRAEAKARRLELGKKRKEEATQVGKDARREEPRSTEPEPKGTVTTEPTEADSVPFPSLTC